MGSVLALTLLWYASWMLTNLNMAALGLALLLVVASAPGCAPSGYDQTTELASASQLIFAAR